MYIFKKCVVIGFISIIIIMRFSQVGGHCKSQGKSHKKGEIWYGKDNCNVFECGKNSRITEYEKKCPNIPACISSEIYMKDCCEYCNEGTIPTEDNGNSCKRSCKRGESMSCKFTFSVEVFQSLSVACFNCPSNSSDCDRQNCIPADGITREIIVANRMMPGPAIEVCLNDTVVVDVQNALISQSTAVHWLGIKQTRNAYADGVPFITQCPISEFDTFRYVFPAEDAGTQAWHSVFGLEVMDGLQGSLIIRQPVDDDPQEKLYDKDEHIMFLQDWNHHYSEQKFYAHYMTNTSIFPNNILINGRGRILNPEKYTFVYSSEKETAVPGSPIPFSEFRVSQGNRYRIRIINGANSNCPLAVSIDNHTMTLISTDGCDIQPYELSQLVLNNGERFDIVINANQTMDKYWIRVRGLKNCQQMKLQQFAILRYEGSSSGDPDQSLDYDYPPGTASKLTTVESIDLSGNTVQLTDLRALDPIESGLDTKQPDYQYMIGIRRNSEAKNSMLMASPDSSNQETFQYDNITFKFPPSPLMTQHLDDLSIFCNETTLQNKDCSREHCSCVHKLDVKLNSIVEVILMDPEVDTFTKHPIHLHGFKFSVVGVGRISGISKNKIRQMDKQGKIKRNFDHPIKKDVVSVYQSGYTIIRFNASNPGYWIMDTTVKFHNIMGMALVFKVGDLSEFPPVPTGLPTCFNYVPT